MRELRVAESAGFCFGVQRSVEMAEKLLESGPCLSLGQLIHNDGEVEATLQKSIMGYDGSSKSASGWYTIASPVDNEPVSSTASTARPASGDSPSRCAT